MTRIRVVLVAVAAAWIAALIQVGQPLGWDELEYFRAARWVSEGQVPYRDFWEHHPPLQWFLFAPVAALMDGPGAGAVVAMRWAQAALSTGAFALLFALMRRGGVPRSAGLMATALILASPTFFRSAIEFRVDVLGNLAYLGGLLLACGAMRRWNAVAFGAVMSAAVLANMRLAPLVVITAVIILFWRAEERRWGWNGSALWIAAGVGGMVAVFLGWLQLSGAFPGFLEGVIEYNRATGDVLDVDTFFVTLFAPIWALDVAGVLFWLGGVVGMILAFREIRSPGPLQIAAVLLIASVGTVAALQVHYPYHFQNAWLLLLPLAAAAISRFERWGELTTAVAPVAIVLNLLTLAGGGFGNEMRYQDEVMRAADRLTRPDEAVWDGTGYALRRPPAYRYWFFPTGLRFLAADGKVEPYEPQRDPPAAIVYNLRLARWFEIFPRTAFYAVHHYVPLYRNLWIPGLSAAVPPGRRLVWSMAREGEYEVHASSLLLRHPWLERPLEYAAVNGPSAARYEIDLDRLPAGGAERLRWWVDGKELPAGTRSFRVRRGARVELISTAPEAIGVLVVPRGIRRLARGPAETFEF